MPASAATSAPPLRISPRTSSGSAFVGKPTTFSAKRGSPPIAQTSERAFAAAIRPKSKGDSTTGVKKSSVERIVSASGSPPPAEAEDGRVVGRLVSDESARVRNPRQSPQQPRQVRLTQLARSPRRRGEDQDRGVRARDPLHAASLRRRRTGELPGFRRGQNSLLWTSLRSPGRQGSRERRRRRPRSRDRACRPSQKPATAAPRRHGIG